MLEVEFMLPLQNGGLISYKDAFSPFAIYDVGKIRECYLLVPKPNQANLQGVIIVANETGIRVCKQNRWPKSFVSKVRQVLDCKDHNKFTMIDYHNIPTDIQNSIVENLISQISYKSI